MKTKRSNATRTDSRVYDIAIAGEAIGIPISRRARLMGASALAGGALRGLAIAAGMMTVFGASPALAQCFSGSTPAVVIDTAVCDVAAATGGASTAVGLNANATGINATAYGNGAVANGDNATATGVGSTANGAFATATGSFNTANGSAATATGANSIANGTRATATGLGSNANGFVATATGADSLATGDFATATGQGSTANGLYRIPEIVTLGRFPGGGESDSRWRTREVRHVGSDTLTPGF